ncbi:tubulin-specific chaperone B [[Candida] railenensis]|uniref:Tubulin-specific chaperone B n=1 Tax=[Candida] railenensis TaxID=45579 RepID=A0A9P0QR53_9ASCO|nr:tubulin-specific chaperone B [[Candida] railenensis]
MSDISIFVTSELTSSERRISPQWDLSYFKIKLEQITGVEPKYQTILLYPNSTSNEYVVISDSNEYSEEKDRSVHISSIKGVVPYCRFHVKDGNPDSVLAQLEQEEQAQDGQNEAAYEFKLSEDEYAKKNNTVLNWKKSNQLGRFDPQFNEIKQRNIEENLEISSSMKTGDMCRVINIQGERRGVVKFVGKIPELSKGEEDEIWVGVEFHEPVGKNDGTIDGRRIFECRQNHGSILKPKQVEVGDFPELDPFADSDDEL